MGLVYSTEKGRICPQCSHPLNACQCKITNAKQISHKKNDGIVRLQRQTQGRGGKVVTTITGIDLPAEELKQLAKKLKQACGSGGTINDGVIEIQGDHRTGLKSELEILGYTVKLAGG
jgi:translation initiation factor 1